MGRPEYSGNIGAILEQWLSIGAKLSALYKQHDETISSVEPELVNTEALDRAIAEAEHKQHDLMFEMAKQPSRTRDDMIAKINVWKSIAMPGDTPNMWMQPSDCLVHSVFTDIENKVLAAD